MDQFSSWQLTRGHFNVHGLNSTHVFLFQNTLKKQNKQKKQILYTYKSKTQTPTAEHLDPGTVILATVRQECEAQPQEIRWQPILSPKSLSMTSMQGSPLTLALETCGVDSRRKNQKVPSRISYGLLIWAKWSLNNFILLHNRPFEAAV